MPRQDGAQARATMADGYTRVPNGLLEALSTAPLNRAHIRTLLFVIRRTLGWANAGHGPHGVDVFTRAELAQATGMPKGTAGAALAYLQRASVIHSVPVGTSGRRAYGVVTDVGEWGKGLPDWDGFHDALRAHRANGLFRCSTEVDTPRLIGESTPTHERVDPDSTASRPRVTDESTPTQPRVEEDGQNAGAMGLGSARKKDSKKDAKKERPLQDGIHCRRLMPPPSEATVPSAVGTVLGNERHLAPSQPHDLHLIKAHHTDLRNAIARALQDRPQARRIDDWLIEFLHFVRDYPDQITEAEVVGRLKSDPPKAADTWPSTWMRRQFPAVFAGATKSEAELHKDRFEQEREERSRQVVALRIASEDALKARRRVRSQEERDRWAQQLFQQHGPETAAKIIRNVETEACADDWARPAEEDAANDAVTAAVQ